MHEAIVSGYWFKRWNGESDSNGESDWNGGDDWINLYIRDECWSRKSSRRNDLIVKQRNIQSIGTNKLDIVCFRKVLKATRDIVFCRIKNVI